MKLKDLIPESYSMDKIKLLVRDIERLIDEYRRKYPKSRPPIVRLEENPRTGYYGASRAYGVYIEPEMSSSDTKELVDTINKLCRKYNVVVSKPNYGTARTLISFGQYTNESVSIELNESSIGSALNKLKSVAKKLADKYTDEAQKHVKVDKLVSKAPDLNVDKVVGKLKRAPVETENINEGFMDGIRNLSLKTKNIFKTLSILSAIGVPISYANYLENSFSSWFYNVILSDASPTISNALQQVHSGQATLDSVYGKFFVVAFAVMFVMYLLTSIISNIGKNESSDRDYKEEYKKYQSSPKMKKYRAELNKYNRDKGTYGNGDGKDASHKGGKIAGFESESKNRGRREKSRKKGSKRK